MSKRGIPAGAVVRGTDKGYDHAAPGPRLKPGSERPVEKIDQTYPYLRPRDAATLILVRQRGKIPEVLLGCRDAKHAFMPNRYVFPGGRVDPADARVPVATPPARTPRCCITSAWWRTPSRRFQRQAPADLCWERATPWRSCSLGPPASSRLMIQEAGWKPAVRKT